MGPPKKSSKRDHKSAGGSGSSRFGKIKNFNLNGLIYLNLINIFR